MPLTLWSTLPQRVPPPAATPRLCCKTNHPLAVVRSSGSGLQPQHHDAGLQAQTADDSDVPGGYEDSLSSNTELGRAVKDACTELETLGDLEQESLRKANELLKKLGYKGDIMQADSSPEDGH